MHHCERCRPTSLSCRLPRRVAGGVSGLPGNPSARTFFFFFFHCTELFKLVRKANSANRLPYIAGAVRPVYRTTRAFSLPKDRLPTFSQSNLIYLYECRNCGKRYAGRTEQRLDDRIDQHVPKHIITEPEPGEKTRGRPPKERSNPAEGYDSAIACHLAANKTCSRRYEVGDFSVLTRARTKNHLNVLEAVYISVLNPVLCKQKSFVTSLTLFQRTQRTHPP